MAEWLGCWRLDPIPKVRIHLPPALSHRRSGPAASSLPIKLKASHHARPASGKGSYRLPTKSCNDRSRLPFVEVRDLLFQPRANVYLMLEGAALTDRTALDC